MSSQDSSVPQSSVTDSIFKWNVTRYSDDLLSKLKTGVNDSFLDVGCGSGLFTEKAGVRGAFCVGIDIRLHRNWRNHRLPNCQFIVCDARQLPFVTGAF